MAFQEVYYVTGNESKYKEVREYFEKYTSIRVHKVFYDLAEIQTLDQKAIAVDKARQAYALVQKPVLVDDAGMYFPQYHQFPGVYTKFVYKGLGLQGTLKLVQPGDKVYFLMYMVLYYGPHQYEVFEGRCDGSIRYPNNYDVDPLLPYDKILVPDGTNKTYEELRADGVEFTTYNYRARGLKKCVTWLQEYEKEVRTETKEVSY